MFLFKMEIYNVVIYYIICYYNCVIMLHYFKINLY